MRETPDPDFWAGRLGVAGAVELIELAHTPDDAWTKARDEFRAPVARRAFRRVMGMTEDGAEDWQAVLAEAEIPADEHVWPAVHALLVSAYVRQREPRTLASLLRESGEKDLGPWEREGEVDRRAAALELYATQPGWLLRVQALHVAASIIQSRYRTESRLPLAEDWPGALLDSQLVCAALPGWREADTRRPQLQVDAVFRRGAAGHVYVLLRRSTRARPAQVRAEMADASPQAQSVLIFTESGGLRIAARGHKSMADLAERLLTLHGAAGARFVADETPAPRDRRAALAQALLTDAVGGRDGQPARLGASAVTFEGRHLHGPPPVIRVSRAGTAALHDTLSQLRVPPLWEHLDAVQEIEAEFDARPVHLQFAQAGGEGLVYCAEKGGADSVRDHLQQFVKDAFDIDLASPKQGRQGSGRMLASDAGEDARRCFADAVTVTAPTDAQERLLRSLRSAHPPLVTVASRTSYRCASTSWSGPDSTDCCPLWVEVERSGRWDDADDMERDYDTGQIRCGAGHLQDRAGIRWNDRRDELRVALERDAVATWVAGLIKQATGVVPVAQRTGVWLIPTNPAGYLMLAYDREAAAAWFEKVNQAGVGRAVVVWCSGPERCGALPRDLGPRLLFLGDLRILGGGAIVDALRAEVPPIGGTVEVRADVPQGQAPGERVGLRVEGAGRHIQVFIAGEALTRRRGSTPHQVLAELVKRLKKQPTGQRPDSLSRRELADALALGTEEVRAAVSRLPAYVMARLPAHWTDGQKKAALKEDGHGLYLSPSCWSVDESGLPQL